MEGDREGANGFLSGRLAAPRSPYRGKRSGAGLSDYCEQFVTAPRLPAEPPDRPFFATAPALQLYNTRKS